jgi:hypothetical protein
MVNDTSCKVEDCHSELAKNPVKMSELGFIGLKD